MLLLSKPPDAHDILQIPPDRLPSTKKNRWREVDDSIKDKLRFPQRRSTLARIETSNTATSNKGVGLTWIYLL